MVNDWAPIGKDEHKRGDRQPKTLIHQQRPTLDTSIPLHSSAEEQPKPQEPEPEEILLPLAGKVWNIPHPTLHFHGRRDDLVEIRKTLSSSGIVSIVPASNDPNKAEGIGKTELAFTYADQLKQNLRIGWWIRTADETTRLADYLELGRQLGLPLTPEEDPLSQVDLIRSQLGFLKGTWLLIFDDASTPLEIVDFVPPGTEGSVIVTSRYPAEWQGKVTTHELSSFSREESVTYLTRTIPDADSEDANTLAESLNNLPAALAQAAAYIGHTGSTISQYNTVLAKENPSPAGILSMTTEESIREIWKVTRIATKDLPAAHELLHIMAWFAPDNIPDSIFSTKAIRVLQHLGNDNPKDHLDSELTLFEKSVETLDQFSLIQRTPAAATTSRVHPLFQAAVRHQLGDKALYWLPIAIDILADAYPTESWRTDTWVECGLLTPHALMIIDYALTYNVVIANLGVLLHNTALYLQFRYQQYGKARDLLQHALAINESIFGSDHLEVGITLGNLGRVEDRLGNYDVALLCLQQALEIESHVQGVDHPDVARTLTFLGRVFYEIGQLEKARQSMLHALEIFVTAFGENDPAVARAMGYLGIIENQLGNLITAHEYRERAREIFEQA